MSVVQPVAARLSTTAGGFLLVTVMSGLGFAFYVAGSLDSISASAQANAVAVPPLVRAEPMTFAPPNIMRMASMALSKPVAASVSPSDQGARIRELQKALARAECYNGPISGIWSDASKDAMRGFVGTVNAQLPVDSPDEALVALVESNDMAKCARGRAISTGTLASSDQPAGHSEAHTQISSSSQASPSATLAFAHQTDEPAMLDRAWAPAEMLVPSKATAANATIAARDNTPPPAAELTADNEPLTAAPDPATQSSSGLHFEDNKAVPAVQSPDPSKLAAQSDEPPPAKTKKVKTAKRKPAQDDDVTTSISKQFDSWQRSISSMF